MNTNVVKVRLARELPLVHLVANDVIRLSTVGQRMTEQKNSSKLQHLLKHFCLSRWNFSKQLSIENSPIYFQQFIQLFMQHADEIKLHEVVDLEQLQAVVKRYAFEMQLGAGLLEFIGEIAQRIYLSAMKSPIQLQDLVSDHQFEMWLSKFLEMEHIPHYLNQF